MDINNEIIQIYTEARLFDRKFIWKPHIIIKSKKITTSANELINDAEQKNL